jgi:phosphoglycolate phosphatase-like HAD superfamily hydrolase
MIFDLDGTLADTVPVCLAALRDVLAEFAGRDYADEEIVAMFGQTEEGIIRRVVPGQWERALEAFNTAYERRHQDCSAPFPGIRSALDLLAARGVHLAIVTGKARPSAEYSLRHLGLARALPLVEVGSPHGPIKPEGLRRVVAHWRMKPRDAAYLGDADSDVAAALTVGLVPLQATWASSAALTGEGSAAAAATFASVDEFVSWIPDHFVDERR